jgi:hypothetical protein
MGIEINYKEKKKPIESIEVILDGAGGLINLGLYKGMSVSSITMGFEEALIRLLERGDTIKLHPSDVNDLIEALEKIKGELENA